MRQWTAEDRARQAELIHRWQPWKKAGVKTPEGKAVSRMNAYKHGLYGEEVRTMRHYLAQSREILKQVQAMRVENKKMKKRIINDGVKNGKIKERINKKSWPGKPFGSLSVPIDGCIPEKPADFLSGFCPDSEIPGKLYLNHAPIYPQAPEVHWQMPDCDL